MYNLTSNKLYDAVFTNNMSIADLSQVHNVDRDK